MLANYYNYKMKNANYLIIIITIFIYFIQAPRASEARASSKKSGVSMRANVCADHVFPEPGEISGPHVSFRLAKFPIKASQISY